MTNKRAQNNKCLLFQFKNFAHFGIKPLDSLPMNKPRWSNRL